MQERCKVSGVLLLLRVEVEDNALQCRKGVRCQDVAQQSSEPQTNCPPFLLLAHQPHFLWQWNTINETHRSTVHMTVKLCWCWNTEEQSETHEGAEWNTRVLILNRFTFLKHTTAQIDCPCPHAHCTSFHGELVKHRRGQWDTEWKHTIGETARENTEEFSEEIVERDKFATLLPHLHAYHASTHAYQVLPLALGSYNPFSNHAHFNRQPMRSLTWRFANS